MDVLENLNRQIAEFRASDRASYELLGVLVAAKREIEHLRQLAGAVSNGESFAVSRAGMRAFDKVATDMDRPILKAFDGA